MIELPIPMSRADCYLATAAGMVGVTLPTEPLSREEDYLAKIAGENIITPTPMSLKEQWLAIISGDTSVTMPAIEGAFLIGQQMVRAPFLANCAGADGVVLPTDPNRTEQYFIGIAENQHHGVLKTATGTYIVLTDVVRGIESLDYIYGDTTQQTYSGKNLIPFTNQDVTVSTLHIYVSNGTLYLNGQPTSDIGSNHPTWGNNFSFTLQAGTYTYSGNTELSRSIRRKSDDAILVTTSIGVESNSFTLTEETEVYFCMYISSSKSFSNTKFEVQLESGSTVNPFEPYVGGIASPNPDYPQTVNVVAGEQNVWVHGKNMFNCPDSATVSNTTFTRLGDNSFNATFTKTSTSSQSAFTKIQILGLKPNTSYVATYEYDVTGTSWNNAGKVRTQIDGVWSTQFYTNQITFTTNATTNDVWLAFSNAQSVTTTGANSINFTNIQIKEGPTPAPYEPYQGATYTIDLGSIELCKIGTYQDKIYKSGGDWYVHKETSKLVLDGSEDENWAVGGSGTANFYYRAIIPQYLTASPAYSNYFTRANVTSSSTNVGFALVNNTTARFRPNFAETSLPDWRTWLSSHNTLLYYIVTATDTKITDATLISQLNALDSAVLPTPNAYIEVTPTGTNLAGALEISYYGEEE